MIYYNTVRPWPKRIPQLGRDNETDQARRLNGGVMATKWYVVRSKPRKEEVVYQQLRTQGIESYFPRIRVNPVNPRARKLKPYFPGYLFVHVDLEEAGVSTFKWMPHALGLVAFDDEPATVPDLLIHKLKTRLQEINASGGEVLSGLKPGDPVRIQEGPFEGYEGVFDTRLPGSERVRVLLQLLNDKRLVPVELHSGQIQKGKPGR